MIRSFLSRHRALRAGLLYCVALCAFSSIVSAVPSLSIAIDGPATISGGADITYTITVTNLTLIDITGVTMSDPLPGTETYVSLIADGSFVCTPPTVGANGTISCINGTVLASSSVQFVVVANIPSGTVVGTMFTNGANVPPSIFDSTTATVVGNADLNIIMTGPAMSNAGANIVYTTTVTNNGPDTATPTVTDVTPSGLTFVSNTGGCVIAFPCVLSSMVSGATFVITSTYSTTGATTGTITNTAAVTSADTDSNLANNSSSQATVMIPQADISVTNTAAATAIVGSNLTYTITVTNVGPSTAGIVTVTDTLPAGTAFVSATPSTGTCSGTTTVSCALGTMASSLSITIPLVVQLNTAGSISNTATAGASTTDPTPGNNSATAETTVIAPPTISKVFGAGSIPLESTTSLSFTIHNPNSATVLTGIGFTDTLPDGLIVATPNGLTGGCDLSTTVMAGSTTFHPEAPSGPVLTAVPGSGAVSISGVHLAPAASCTFSIQVQGTTVGVKPNVTSVVSSTEGGPGTVATASLTVLQLPPTITKTFGADNIPFNGTTSLSFTIHNPNPANILSLVGFSDALPPGLIVATPNGFAGGCAFTPTINRPASASTENLAPAPGIITAVAGSGLVSLSGTTLLPNGSCTFSVTVQGTTAGLKTNITSAISSTQGGSGTTASAFLTVLPPPPPTVTSTFPANLAVTVPIGDTLAVTFSTAMNASTINTSTFTLKHGTISIPGVVTASGVTAIFTPSSLLAPSTVFTATITTGAKDDIAGDGLVSNYVWTFTTGAKPETTPPAVTFTFPANGAVSVPIGDTLAAIFSEALNPLTINTSTFTLQNGLTPVAGTVGYAGATATFTPHATLAPNTLFTATISASVKDLAGNALVSNYVWSFTTGATADTTPPVVTATVPADGATQVTTSSNVTVDFSEFMNPMSISTATFMLDQVTTPQATTGSGSAAQQPGTTPVAGTVTYAGTSATFRPTNNLLPFTRYNAVISSTSADLAGNTLTVNHVWSFTTGSSADQAPVCLADFAVLSGSAIVNSGPTVITGDIGASLADSVTGFPPGTVTGTIHAADAAVAQAILDLSAAYGDAVLRSAGAVPVSGDLGGQTLTAGLYKSVSSLNITSSDLTLDAKGDPNAIFIFQIASTLTTAAGTHVILAGGASAFNVFWQVGTSATLGANSVFNGSILADQSIMLTTGAIVDGRLLAQNGTVTLQSNTITSFAPGISVDGIVNAASDARTAVAGSIESVFGRNLGSSLMLATGYPLSTTLGGSSFQIGTQSAPLYMTSCNQQNLQIPWEAVGQVNVTATVGGLVSAQQTLTLTQFAPGIFSMNQSGSGQGAVEIAPTSQLAAPLGPTGHPVKAGEYIAIFCTGLGPVSNRPPTGAAALSDPLSSTLTPVTVSIGGAAAKVSYAGLAPGFAGLYQVNALVPDGVPSGDNITLVISIGGVRSNAVTIAVH